MGIRILGTGSYLPPKVVTNDDIAAALDTSDEWIYSHTGIHARHVAEEGETTSTMGAKAAKAALEMAKVAPEEIGLIVLATSTPDYATFPSTACVVQDMLGCVNAGAFDLQAACAGFIYALEQARGFVNFYPDKKALVIGAECLTRILDWTDRSSCILFGDGAGAVVLGNDEAPGVASTKTAAHTILGADGKGQNFIMRTGGTRVALPLDPVTGIPLKPEPQLSQLTLRVRGPQALQGRRRPLREARHDSRRARPRVRAPGERTHHRGHREAHEASAREVLAQPRDDREHLRGVRADLARPGRPRGRTEGRDEDRHGRLRRGTHLRRHILRVAGAVRQFKGLRTEI